MKRRSRDRQSSGRSDRTGSFTRETTPSVASAMADAVLGQRRGSVGVTVSLSAEAAESVRKLRRRVDHNAYRHIAVEEAWLEIAETDPESGNLGVVKRGKKYKKLVSRVKKLAATDSPRFFVGVTRKTSRRKTESSLEFITFVFRWIGVDDGNMTTRRLAYSMAFQGIQADLAKLMYAEVVVDDATNLTDLSRSALRRRPRARQHRIDGAAVNTMGNVKLELSADFISQNPQLARTFQAIRQDMTSDDLTWMVLGYHPPAGGSGLGRRRRHGRGVESLADVDDEDDEDDVGAEDYNEDGYGGAGGRDGEEEDEAEDDSNEDSNSGPGASESALALPVLLARGGGGIEAFDLESGGILNTVAYRPGWLYWIYARVEVDAIEGTGRFRAGSHLGQGGREPGLVSGRPGGGSFSEGTTMGPVAGGCKFLLITYHGQSMLPAMSLRLNEHRTMIGNLFKHHVHMEASSLSDLSEENVAQRLLANTDGNRMVLTVTVGSGSGGTLRRMVHAQREPMSAPLLIRISPREPLSELKRRIAYSYKVSPDSVIIMRVVRKANRDVISALISSTSHARSEADLTRALQQASAQVEVVTLEGDHETLSDVGLVSGEELYVKLLKDGSKRDSLHIARQMNEMPLVERRRVAVEQFREMRQREQRMRMPLFTSMRHLDVSEADDDVDEDELDTFDYEHVDTEDDDSSAAAEDAADQNPAPMAEPGSLSRGSRLKNSFARASSKMKLTRASSKMGLARASSKPRMAVVRGSSKRQVLKPSPFGGGGGFSAAALKGAKLKNVAKPVERNGFAGGATSQDDAERIATSNQYLESLADEAVKMNAMLIEDEDLVTLTSKCGVGRTAEVYKGVLLCKIDEVDESALGDLRKKSRAMSTRASWARLRKKSIAAKAEDAEEIMNAASERAGDDQDQMFVAVTVAVKQFTARRVTKEVYTAFMEEIHVLGKLHHESLVQILGVFIDTSTRDPGDERPLLKICYEFMPRGSLATLRKSDDWLELPFPYKIKMALNVARGLAYLHEHDPPVAHRDLKSDNLLLDEDFSVIKIGDFGTATFVEGPLKGKMGTAGWTAPEILADAEYDIRCDIFSFGVILWEIVTMIDNPLRGVAEEAYLKTLHAGYTFEVPDDVDPEYADLMVRCQSYDPDERPPASEIVEVLENVFQRIVQPEES